MKYQVLFQIPDDILRERLCLVQWIRVAGANLVCGERIILRDLNVCPIQEVHQILGSHAEYCKPQRLPGMTGGAAERSS